MPPLNPSECDPVLSTARTISRQKRVGITTLVSSVLILFSVVWATYTFILVQFGQARSETPHEPYDEVPYWPYDIPWLGGSSNWFENVNYTHVPLDISLPDDLLDHLDDVVFYVVPDQPPQLWRTGAYDGYDGHSWQKTIPDSLRPLGSTELINRSTAEALGNEIYLVILNLTAGPVTGQVELPVLFPQTLVISDSFRTASIVQGSLQYDSPSRLIQYDLQTDIYGTVIFTPLLDAPTGTSVLVVYEVTYILQDLDHIQSVALRGIDAPASIRQMYGLPSLTGVELSQAVIDNISQFIDAGDTAYETAQIVSSYFKSRFELMLTSPEVFERPASDQEVTDWFLARGGGLPMDFATAFCVFMRYLDIPARLVIGYAVGDAETGYRTIRVRHMMFWAEVYVPMNDPHVDGEWIQVIPIPLPPEMGGSDIPENTDPGLIQLIVGHSRMSEGWVLIGEEFQLFAALLINGVPVSNPEVISFYDVTANRVVGSAVIERTSMLAVLNYTFPSNTIPGLHNISAVYRGSAYDVYNYTTIYAVGTPNPLNVKRTTAEYVLSETVDVDLRLGLDNHTAKWGDILHVHGVMTVGGIPVNGNQLNNNQIQIMWDESFIGNATIQSDGSYSFDIAVSPSSPLMRIGQHLLWSSYAGEYYNGIPILLPARSADNSTVDIWAAMNIHLAVSPPQVARGGSLHYQGQAWLLNGTYLRGASIGLFFDGQWFDDVTTNNTGGFDGYFIVPYETLPGFHTCQANWTALPGMHTVGNWSNTVLIEVIIKGAAITINSTPSSPDVVHFLENIKISGRLTDRENGSALVGRLVHVWWERGGELVYLGNSTTDHNGDYQVTYLVPIGYEGVVRYWAEFISPDPQYGGARSANLSILVTNYATILTVFSDRQYYHLNQTVHIWGRLTLENGTPLVGVWINLYWFNGTPMPPFSVLTNGSGWYNFYYDLSLSDQIGTVDVEARFNSWTRLYDNATAVLSPSIRLQLYQIFLIVFLDKTRYHLDEVIMVSGTLTFAENGAPIPNAIVRIYYEDSAHNLYWYNRMTNSAGQFVFYYNCTLADPLGPIRIWAEYYSTNPLWNDSRSTDQYAVLVLYQLLLTCNTNSTRYHLNETIWVSGSLSFSHNGTPIQGQEVTIYMRWSNGTIRTFRTSPTYANGTFHFYYTLLIGRDTVDIVMVWAEYVATNPLWDNASSYPGTSIELTLYIIELSMSVPSQVYIDQSLVIEGRLTYEGGSIPLVNQLVVIYLLQNGNWVTVDTVQTNSTGWFRYLYNFTLGVDGPGLYVFKCNYTSTDPLNSDAEALFSSTVLRYTTNIDILVIPTTTYLNRSIVIYVHVYFANGTPVVGERVYIYWGNNSGNSLILSGVTNSTGWIEFEYFGFEDHNDLHPWIYAVFESTLLLEGNRSIDIQLTLERWQTLINGFHTSTLVVYVTESVIISGYLWYDLPGTDAPYAYANVTILLDGNVLAYVLTNSDGSFIYEWTVPRTIGWLGIHYISVAFESPVNWISGTWVAPIALNVIAHMVVWSIDSSQSWVYRGGTAYIYGYARLDNGTALSGYTVYLVWNEVLVVSNTTDASGLFQLVYSVSWTSPVGPLGYYIYLEVRVEDFFLNVNSTDQLIEIRDLISIILDPQSVFVLHRGDSLTLTGLVTNGGGVVAQVPLIVVFNDTLYFESGITFANGRYVISGTIPYSYAPGVYTVRVVVDSSYYDVYYNPVTWYVTILLRTQFEIELGVSHDLMPNEPVMVYIALLDEEYHLVYAPVSVYLGDIYLGTVPLHMMRVNSSYLIPVSLQIPESCESGLFYIKFIYEGGGVYENTSAVTATAVHVFTQARISGLTSVSTQPPNLPLVVRGQLLDDKDIPIAGRILSIRSGTTIDTFTTNRTGWFEYILDPDPIVGTYTYSLSLTLSGNASIDLGTFTVVIQSNTGDFMQLDLLAFGLGIGITVTLGVYYLWYVRGIRFRRPVRAMDMDSHTKLRNIKKLADAGKYAEAIRLAYKTFEQMCGARIDSPRQSSETAREYMERVLKSISLDGETVELFIRSYEEARFSDHEISRDLYDTAIKAFTDLYPRVEVGKASK